MKSFFEFLLGAFSLLGAVVLIGIIFSGIFAAMALVPVFILAAIGAIAWKWLGFLFFLLALSLVMFLTFGAIGEKED